MSLNSLCINCSNLRSTGNGDHFSDRLKNGNKEMKICDMRITFIVMSYFHVIIIIGNYRYKHVTHECAA